MYRENAGALEEAIKVQLFWPHKNLRDLSHGLEVYQVNVQTLKKIVLSFVAFSEKLNFKEG